jgi:hypothetical protein
MRTFLLLTMTAVLGVLSAVAQSNVKRLDGSQITPVEIDAGVTRLMRAAEVTGVGLAIFNDGKVAYLKAYGVRDKEKNLLLKPWPGVRDGAAHRRPGHSDQADGIKFCSDDNAGQHYCRDSENSAGQGFHVQRRSAWSGVPRRCAASGGRTATIVWIAVASGAGRGRANQIARRFRRGAAASPGGRRGDISWPPRRHEEARI